MAADSMIDTVLAAVISGGGTAVSTILAFFRDVKKRIDAIEQRLGSVEEKKGLAYAIFVMEDGLNVARRLRQEVDGWHNAPPEWAIQLLGRRRSPSLVNFEDFNDKFRAIERRIKDLEEYQGRLEKQVSKCVTDKEFDTADKERADEIATIKNTVFEVKGLLQGLQSALGLFKGK